MHRYYLHRVSSQCMYLQRPNYMKLGSQELHFCSNQRGSCHCLIERDVIPVHKKKNPASLALGNLRKWILAPAKTLLAVKWLGITSNWRGRLRKSFSSLE
jgi:hypothetical protein